MITVKDGKDSEAYLELEGLFKHYGSVRAVDGVSLSMDRGEFLTLLGPSGSGKTTLLMMVAGFVIPDKGRVILEGRELTQVPPYSRGLGMVFQNYALFPHMTVFENVAFALRMRKRPSSEIRQRVDEALAMVHLEGLGGRLPSQLSGGQQQRVSLARALVYRPHLLLMDEPLGALDKKLREAMQIELKHIQQQVGITVLYVTHDQEEALTLSDRVAVMRNGRLEQVGSAYELYENPASRFVADFIGETNFLDVRVESIEEDSIIVSNPSIPRIRVPKGSGFAVGQEAHLSIRPEKITFVNGSDSVNSTVSGVVEEIIYMGDITKYYIKLEKGGGLILKQHNREGIRRPDRGEKVTIGWNPINSVALKP
ncbi:MAG: ABC transporter ATP-binding protein [Deltaproteobacteria bacterium]|nr:ABC transporter ATP-binding protein [Deltaproteobacteria bacterium]MBW2122153.1 ABC transporter ATP-binding protein [Deltaproteobacteria bacterium]